MLASPKRGAQTSEKKGNLIQNINYASPVKDQKKPPLHISAAENMRSPKKNEPVLNERDM
jgi:hypothetical protein